MKKAISEMNKPAYATVHAGFLQQGMSKKEYVATEVMTSLLASGQWSGKEEAFFPKIIQLTEDLFKHLYGEETKTL
jgi:hypothetical protein